MPSNELNEFYGFVAVGDDGRERFVSYTDQKGTVCPMLGPCYPPQYMIAYAQSLASDSGKRIKIVKWSVREDMATIEPHLYPVN